MVPASYNITYYRGDTFTLTVKVLDANGQNLNVQRFDSVTFGLNRDRGVYSNPITMSAALDKNNSTVTCTIGPTVGATLSGSYQYDIVLYKLNGGLVSEEYTVMTGTVTVQDDVVKPDGAP